MLGVQARQKKFKAAKLKLPLVSIHWPYAKSINAVQLARLEYWKIFDNKKKEIATKFLSEIFGASKVNDICSACTLQSDKLELD